MSVCVNSLYNNYLIASGSLVKGSNIVWSIVAGSLPPGIKLTGSTNVGIFYGTPTVEGNYTFSVRVTVPGVGSQTKQYTICVVGITPPILADGTVGIPYSQAFSVTSCSVAPVVFVKTIGTLPNGLTLSPTGVLSGTPTVAGAYSFTIQFTDSSPAPTPIPPSSPKPTWPASLHSVSGAAAFTLLDSTSRTTSDVLSQQSNGVWQSPVAVASPFMMLTFTTTTKEFVIYPWQGGVRRLVTYVKTDDPSTPYGIWAFSSSTITSGSPPTSLEVTPY